MGRVPHETDGRPRERLSRYLRDQYRHGHATKELARVMRSTPKAAENVLAGHWPNDLHFGAIVRQFGRDLLDAVFTPDIDPVVARLEEEERQLDRQLQATRARKRQVKGRYADHPDLFEKVGLDDEGPR